MIISKLSLRRTAGAQGALARLLLDGAEVDRGHGLLWSLFSTGESDKRAFLYRQIEPGRFIAVSQHPPADPNRLWQIESKPYAPELAPGARLGFTLRANPAITVRVPGGPRGKRADAVMHAKFKLPRDKRAELGDGARAALDWLYVRGSALGAEFDRDRCSVTGYQQIVIRRRDGCRPVIFSEIDFDGVLTVTDPARLTQALLAGVGKARAYGCGLMLVRPAG
jgi:CRISPR system Cascade subunit CasE